MSDANRSSIGYIAETVWGTTPTTPTLAALRFTKDALAHNKTTVVSEEIRADRQLSDLVQVGVNAAGGFNFELSYTSLLPWFAAAISCAPVVINITALSADLVSSTGTITAAGGTWANVIPGAFVRVAGFTNPLNNKVAMVVSKTSTDLVFGSGVFAANQTGATISVKGTQLKNGLERPSFTLERAIPNSSGSNVFQSFTGMCVDVLNLAMESMKIITGDVAFVGKQGASSGTSVSASPYTAAATDDIMNATSNVANIKRDGAAMDERAKTFSLSIKNNLRPKDAIGELGAFDIGQGEFNVTGSLNVYFDSNALYQSFLDHDATSFSWTVSDAAGNTIAFNLPRVKMSAGNPAVSGKNTDNMQQVDFQALLDSTTGATLLVSFVPGS